MAEEMTERRRPHGWAAGEPGLADDDLLDAELVRSRVVADTGHRTELDEVFTALGYDRAELEAELAADLTAEGGGDRERA